MNPSEHRVVPLRGFSELTVGEVFNLPSRTIGEANFAAFQTVSLDNHPIHYDVEYCKRLGYPAPLAHGLQVLCFTAAGAGLFPHVIGEKLIGFIEVFRCTPLFRESGAVGVRLSANWSVMATLERLTNAGACSENRVTLTA